MAVSSAMLLVPTPRYSPASRRCAPSITTTPSPIGPGFPEQAPSVQISTAFGGSPPPAGAGLARGARAALRGAPLDAAGAESGIGGPPSGSGVRFPGDGR